MSHNPMGQVKLVGFPGLPSDFPSLSAAVPYPDLLRQDNINNAQISVTNNRQYQKYERNLSSYSYDWHEPHLEMEVYLGLVDRGDFD